MSVPCPAAIARLSMPRRPRKSPRSASALAPVGELERYGAPALLPG
ncbi:hypothetical protein [Sorangium sp. So ce887]